LLSRPTPTPPPSPYTTLFRSRAIHRRYQPLMEVNFVESNPIPVKAALAEMGLLEPVWRLPLVPPKAENRARIRAVLESLGLVQRDRKSTRLNSSHVAISYAVF